jgi:hypothetical protein
VQFLGHGKEVPQLPRFHAATVPAPNQGRYPSGIDAHPIGVGVARRARAGSGV